MGNIIEIAEAAGMLADPGNSEIIELGAGGQHQIPPLESTGSGGGELLLVQIDVDDTVLQPADATAAEQLAIGGRHFPALQLTAEQLVEEWLKQKAVTGLDQQHRSLRQALAHGQSAEQSRESTTDHHHGLG